MKPTILRWAALAALVPSLSMPSTGFAAPLPSEYHLTAEAKMGPIAALFQIDLYTDSENPIDDGLNIELDFLQLPAPQVSDALLSFQDAMSIRLRDGAEPLQPLAEAFEAWFATTFDGSPTRGERGDYSFSWYIPLTHDGRTPSGLFDGDEFTTRYGFGSNDDRSAFGDILSEMVEGKLPAVEFIGTDSLAYVTQVYNGLIEQPGDQAKFVEEILAAGVLPELTEGTQDLVYATASEAGYASSDEAANGRDSCLLLGLEPSGTIAAIRVFSSRPKEAVQLIGEATDSDVSPKLLARQEIEVYELEITRRGGATEAWTWYTATDRSTGEILDSGWVAR